MADAAASGRLTRDELAESLVFFRRRLAQKIVVAMIQATQSNVRNFYHDPAFEAEDLANAVCERLAARETGSPTGYK